MKNENSIKNIKNMGRKQKFMQAIRALAPDDQFILQAAQNVKEEMLPAFPGGVALEFVAAIHRLRSTSGPRTECSSGQVRQIHQGRQGHYGRQTRQLHRQTRFKPAPHHQHHRHHRPHQHPKYQPETFETCETLRPETKGEYPGTALKPGLSLENALRVKSAEYWLKLGQPIQALMELEKLPENARKNPWAVKVMVSAIGAVREMNCQAHAE